MQAVDSAVGPEVENHQPTGEVSEPERPLHVEPDESRWEIGGPDRSIRIVPVLHESLLSGESRRQW